MHLATSSCNPASHKNSTMVKNYLPRSRYTAFATSSCNPACQERHNILMLSCARPCQWVLSQRIANPHSRSVAVNRLTFAQRWQCELDHTNPALLRTCQSCTIFMWNRALATVWCKFLKVLQTPQLFLIRGSANRALATVSCTFCWPHVPKPLCFKILKCKSSSRHSPALC